MQEGEIGAVPYLNTLVVKMVTAQMLLYGASTCVRSHCSSQKPVKPRG
jgi:hypothetical protein